MRTELIFFNSCLLLAVSCRSLHKDSSASLKVSNVEDSFFELPENYLECQRQDEFLTFCKVTSNNIVMNPRTDIGLSHHYQYLSGCEISSGTWPSTIAINQGELNASVSFDQKSWRDLGKFSGTETIKVVDSKPVITASRKFLANKDCFLKLRYRSELSDVSKSTLSHLIKELESDMVFISALKSGIENIQAIDTNIEKLDLENTKLLFKNFKQSVESSSKEKIPKDVWEEVSRQIDIITIMNPSVDPSDQSHAKLDSAIKGLISAKDVMVNKVSYKVGKNLVEAQKILAFADQTKFAAERKFLKDIENSLEAKN